jgi:hypothetical protein
MIGHVRQPVSKIGLRSNALGAIVTVGGGGRGFVVEGKGYLGSSERYIVTAAHCLPFFPPCMGAVQIRASWATCRGGF